MALNFMPILPPQASPQAQAQMPMMQTMQAQSLPPLPEASPLGMRPGQLRRQAKQDWRALRPQFSPGMDRSQFMTQMQDWRSQRPQFGGMGEQDGRLGIPQMAPQPSGMQTNPVASILPAPGIPQPAQSAISQYAPQLGSGMFGSRLSGQNFFRRRGG